MFLQFQGYASYAATSWVNGAGLVVVTRTDQTSFPIDAKYDVIRFNGIYAEA
jgi:hypothetical protein